MSERGADVAWPSLELDGVRRLRAIAAGLPHVAIRERVLDAPFDVVWGFIGDLERSVPRFESGIARLEILERDGERLRLTTHGWLGMSFEVVLRSGFCLMHNRLADVGMAAASEGPGQTRFAHYEGTRWLGRPGRPLFARKIEGDLDRIERLVETEGAPSNTTRRDSSSSSIRSPCSSGCATSIPPTTTSDCASGY